MKHHLLAASAWLFAIIPAHALVQQLPLQQGSALSTSPHTVSSNGEDTDRSDAVPIANRDFVEYINGLISKWHVHGLAMAIIDGNRTWSKGFGFADKDAPVDASTLFYAGSMTKSFTAAALSLLVDDNSSEYASVQWDSPVSHFLPEEFILSDPWATNHITIADALSHTTGYPRHDYAGPYHNSSTDMIRAFRYLPMSQKPRAKWQYNNMMYATMGYLAERLSNATLANIFRDRLWHPMGMFNTYLHPDDALASNNTLSKAYYWNNDTESYGEISWKDETNIAGAGMSISSVLDWSRYLRHMMDESGPISKAGHTALKAPRVLTGDKMPIPFGPVHYGFGWNSGVFQNEKLWWHSGQVNSMMSFMFFIPRRKLGAVLMMNTESIPALDAIISRTFYDIAGVDQERRVDVEGEWSNKLKEEAIGLCNCSARLYPAAPSPAVPAIVPLSEFAGRYHNAGYGTVSILEECDMVTSPSDSPAFPSLTQDGCILVIRKANLFDRRISYRLEHKSGDSWVGWLFVDDFETVQRPQDCFRVELGLDSTGRPSLLGLDLRMEGEEQPLVWFEKLDPEQP